MAELLLAMFDDQSVRAIASSPKYGYADGSSWPTLEVRNRAAYQLGRLWGFNLDAVLPVEESPDAWQRLRDELVQRAEELGYLREPPTFNEQLRAREALKQAGLLLIEPREPPEREANLAYSKIKDADLRHFGYLPEIDVIDLTHTTITDEGLKELAVCRWLMALELDDTKITDAGSRHLAELPRLSRLNLSDTAVTSAGLAELDGLPALEELDLGMTAVSDDGLPSLSKLPRLARLDLAKTVVTDAGMKHLAAMSRLQ